MGGNGKCSCGAVVKRQPNGVLVAHPDVSFWPVFRWCAFGDSSHAIVGAL